MSGNVSAVSLSLCRSYDPYPCFIIMHEGWKIPFYTLSHIIGYESKRIGWHIADKSLLTVVSLDRLIAHGVNISAHTSKHLRSHDKRLLDKTLTCDIMNRTELHSWWHSSNKWWKSCTGIGRVSLLQSNLPIHFRYCYYKMASWTADIRLQVTA